MATTDLMNEIASNYGHLTKAEKKVADKILSSPQDVLRATITELAEMCGVGDTSVFRFCRTLKLSGYQDFKVSLALSTNSNNMLDARDEDRGFASADLETLCGSVRRAYLEAVEDTFRMLDYDAIRRAVDCLAAARLIYFFGFGGSGITALEAQNKFIKITPNACFTADGHMQLTIAPLLGEDAAAVIFSNSGITKDCIEIARTARQSGARVVFITKFAKTPATAYSDVVLVSGAVEGPMQGGSIAGKTSQLFMVDVLYTEYFRRLGDVSLENKKTTSRAIVEKML